MGQGEGEHDRNRSEEAKTPLLPEARFALHRLREAALATNEAAVAPVHLVIAPSYLQYQRYVNDQVRDHQSERSEYHFVTNPTMLMGYIGEIIVLNRGQVDWRYGLYDVLESRLVNSAVTVKYVD